MTDDCWLMTDADTDADADTDTDAQQMSWYWCWAYEHMSKWAIKQMSRWADEQKRDEQISRWAAADTDADTDADSDANADADSNAFNTWVTHVEAYHRPLDGYYLVMPSSLPMLGDTVTGSNVPASQCSNFWWQRFQCSNVMWHTSSVALPN